LLGGIKMAEVCVKCSKEEQLKYMVERIEKGESDTKDILKIVSDIKGDNTGTKYSLMTIENVLKENKERVAANALKLEAERVEERKAKRLADAELLKEKRALRRAVYVAVAVVLANTAIGMYLG